MFLPSKLKKLITFLLTKNPYRVRHFEWIIKQRKSKNPNFDATLNEVKCINRGENFETKAATLYHENLSGLSKDETFCSPNHYRYSLSNACIIGHIGLVYDAHLRTAVAESAREWEKPLNETVFLSMIRSHPLKKLKGLTLSFLTIGADGGFYHFLFESLPKINIYKKLLVKADQYLFNGPVTHWKLKWLQWLKVDLTKIIWIENHHHFQCEHLMFTNLLINDQEISPWLTHWLKSLLPQSDAFFSGDKKIIWLTRRNKMQRRLAWEDAFLKKYPTVEALDLEDLTLPETQQILSQASHIISAHGAALCNLIFCRAETKVLEIFPLNMPYKPCYARLSAVCHLHHHLVYLNFENQNDHFGLTHLENTAQIFLN